jgi:hypothetical protein
MGRAQRNTPAALSGKQADLATSRSARHQRRRRFNVVVHLQTFNAAAAQRAQLAAIIADLSGDSSQRAMQVHSPMLADFAKSLEIDIRDDYDTIADGADFHLHTELRVALDEGRRLTETDVDAMASKAVRDSGAAVLASRLAGQDGLTEGQWYETLRESLSAAQPKEAFEASKLQRQLLSDLPE